MRAAVAETARIVRANSRTLRVADGPDEGHLEAIAKGELKKFAAA